MGTTNELDEIDVETHTDKPEFDQAQATEGGSQDDEATI